ncbi:MAG: hypothetical protein PHR16_13690 [Methylovulum sp.]|nr:hypothetical protein [Methylovulum sp.]
MITVIAGIAACANNSVSSDNRVARPYLPIDINVQSDNRGSLPEFSVSSSPANYRAYIQATPNDRYRLHVVNNSNQRVGIVIAVDGRNIISGTQSWLRDDERMYILDPHAGAEYEGWRTGSNQVNRFYFTESANSYAAAWGDSSAMGVIAMAVYAERPRPEVTNEMSGLAGGVMRAAPAIQPTPGTGFGETTYSPSYAVNFDPLPEPIEKVFLKYEWRETLCAKRILLDCQDAGDTGGNRFWPDNGGFAPPPPKRY